MENISTHISYKESTRTDTHLPNIPDDQQVVNMIVTANRVFEPVREYFNKPIAISSFFRSKEVNKKIGGAKNSQHLLGKAIDMDAQVLGGLGNKDIFEYIYKYLDYDQLIGEDLDDFGEPNWIHVSYNSPNNRFQTLVMVKHKNKSLYFPYKNSLIKSDYL